MKRQQKSLNQKTNVDIIRKLKWCYNCNSYYHGVYELCNICVKAKRQDGQICWACNNPNCPNPVIGEDTIIDYAEALNEEQSSQQDE